MFYREYYESGAGMRGDAVNIIEYLQTPPRNDEIINIINKLSLPASNLVRTNESIFKELNLSIDEMTNDEIASIIQQHPILLQRPIVISGDKAAIGRAPENVLNIISH